MEARVAIIIGALLVLASCSKDSHVPLTPTPAAPPREPVRELRLTLIQGENLSGPYSGTVTGPNEFACTLDWKDQSRSCPSAQFTEGETITLRVTLTAGIPGDKPIWRTVGCDSVTSNSCTLTMTADRSVTISIGCAIC